MNNSGGAMEDKKDQKTGQSGQKGEDRPTNISCSDNSNIESNRNREDVNTYFDPRRLLKGAYPR